MNYTQTDLDEFEKRGLWSPLRDALAPDDDTIQAPLPPVKLDMAASLPLFRSDTERDAWHHLEQDLRIVKMEYEPMVFHTPAGNYTPDIMTLSDAGKLTFYEVKGGPFWTLHHKSSRSSQNKFWTATALFSWLGDFVLMYPERGEWVRRYWNGRAWRPID